MINATISARLTGNPVSTKTEAGGSVCERQGVLSIYIKDGWYDEQFDFIAFGKTADTLSGFGKPKIMASGEWVVESPPGNVGDRIVKFHIAKIHNA